MGIGVSVGGGEALESAGPLGQRPGPTVVQVERFAVPCEVVTGA